MADGPRRAAPAPGVRLAGPVSLRSTGLGEDGGERKSFQRYCLVLSVGEAKGVAHLGAIEALREAEVPITCVMGNSMGALVGSLYATAPAEDTTQRYARLLNTYRRATEREAEDNAVLAGLFLGVLGAATGGWGFVAGAGIGAGVGAAGTETLDLGRFRSVLSGFYGESQLERLAVPFAATHAQLTGTGIAYKTPRSGSVATAVARSIANPEVFPGFDARRSRYLDPGVDRMARVPVVEACSRFPESLLITINVTAEAAVIPPDVACPTVEVRIPLEAPNEALDPSKPEFKKVVRLGRQATKAALRLERPKAVKEHTPAEPSCRT